MLQLIMNHHVVIVYKDQMIVRVASIDLEMAQVDDYEQAVNTDLAFQICHLESVGSQNHVASGVRSYPRTSPASKKFHQSWCSHRAWNPTPVFDQTTWYPAERYIAVSIRAEHERAEDGQKTTVYLVSTKTLEIERSLSTALKFDYSPRYERGFLVLVSSDSIRLVHAASGRCFSVVGVTGCRGVTSNSRFLVIWEEFYQETVHDEKIFGTKLKLFDLQLLQNASCPDIAPFTEHWVPFVTLGCRVDEIQLVFTCKSNDGELVQLSVFDFSPVEEAIAIF